MLLQTPDSQCQHLLTEFYRVPSDHSKPFYCRVYSFHYGMLIHTPWKDNPITLPCWFSTKSTCTCGNHDHLKYIRKGLINPRRTRARWLRYLVCRPVSLSASLSAVVILTYLPLGGGLEVISWLSFLWEIPPYACLDSLSRDIAHSPYLTVDLEACDGLWASFGGKAPPLISHIEYFVCEFAQSFCLPACLSVCYHVLPPNARY